MVRSRIRDERALIDVRVLAFVLLLFLAGVLWVQLKSGNSTSATRIFRYKDEQGKTIYTDVLEKVPESQRRAALDGKDMPSISKADSDEYISAMERRKTGWGSLWERLVGRKHQASYSESNSVVAKPSNVGQKSSDVSNKELEGRINDIKGAQRFVTNSFTSVAEQLGE